MSDKLKPLSSYMSNDVAYELGLIACKAGRPDSRVAGDAIDHGLILRRLLEEAGYGIVMLKGTPEKEKANER